MIYPFKCKNCGTEFTVSMSVKKYETIKVKLCPICKSENINRTFYSDGVSIQYKDNGFTKYVGDSNE